MAERLQMAAIVPSLLGLPLGQARRAARRHAQATLEFKLVDSEEKALTVVRQFPQAGDELPESGAIKVEIASRPWINFLPGIYQDTDEENADFLRRFLLVSAHLTSGVEENLEFVHELFDPRITDAKWLPWLASWLAMPLLEGWDEEKRREIIQRTPELYRKRGTAEGLKLALRLFADVEAEIHEGEWPYPGLVIGRSSTIGKDTVALAAGVHQPVLHRRAARGQGGDLARAAADRAGAGGDREAGARALRAGVPARWSRSTRRFRSCTWARQGASEWTPGSAGTRTSPPPRTRSCKASPSLANGPEAIGLT